MKRILTSLCLLAFLLWTVSASVPSASGSVGIEVGDYWEYEQDQAEFEGLGVNATMKLRVASVDENVDGGVTRNVFNCSLTSTGSVSGTYENTSVTGTLSITGRQLRLQSNFSLISQTVTVEVNLSSVVIRLSVGGVFNPPLDEYIGDDELALNTVVTSSTHMFGGTHTNMSIPPFFPGLPWYYFDESDVFDADTSYRMKIVDTGIAIETKAGTFDCFKVNATTDSDGNFTYETLYYSEEVGNYVRMEGGDITGGLLGGGMTLVSYSYGGRGTSTNTLLILGGGVIALAVVVAIIALLLMRKRGGMAPAQMQAMQPSPQEVQLPPPGQ